MLTEIAQVITIVSYGNAFLNGERNLEAYTNLKRKSKNIEFKDGCTKDKRIFARDVMEWFKYLEKNGCNKIRLLVTPKPNGIFEGVMINESVQWTIETIFKEYSDYWTYLWHNDYTEYLRIRCNQSITNSQSNLEIVRMDLEQTLNKMIDFAYSINLEADAKFFTHSKKELFSNDPHEPEVHQDIVISSNYGLLAKQILFGAISSWCFSGMGSWSDSFVFPSEKQKTKENITKELFFSICSAIVASVNSF